VEKERAAGIAAAGEGEHETRIYGPPGTGKTTWIAKRVREEVESRGPEAVMITSLTRAAAETIAGRELPIPKENIGTLHSHCYRAIGGGTIAETKYAEWNTRHPEFAISGEEYDLDDADAEPNEGASPGDELLTAYRMTRSRMESRDSLAPSVAKFAGAWERWKEEKGYIDFTDLIERAYHGIAVAPGDPAVIMVDEAQDHDRLELSLIRKWGRYADRFYIVGDPDQAIYEWRGSDPRAFMTPAVPKQNRLILEQSYRVTAAVHRLAVRWISQIRSRESIEYRPKPGAGAVRRIFASHQRPAGLLKDMEQYLRDGKNVMILATCSYMLKGLTAALRDAGIPFHNPYRRKAGHWNPLRAARGNSSTDRVLAYLRPDENAWPEDHRLYTYGDLRLWTEPLKAEGVLRRGMKQQITMKPADEPVHLGQLIGMFEPAAWERIRVLDLDWYLAHTLKPRRRAIEFPLTVLRARGPKALRARPQVIVGTIHSVKGGEADAVYLLPDLAPSAYAEWITAGEAREPLIRLFYVAMTRSKQDLILCSPSGQYRIDGLMPGL
jgi:superfamily I DNA/RNA helicase